jgi:pimeloyl-ACP methyl ester carboxylesterase
MTEIRLPGAGLELVATARGHDDDPIVLLLHGGGQTRHAWEGTATALADRGWRTVAVDARGHGDSDRAPDADYGIDAFVADLEAVVGALSSTPVVVGASLGGLTALVAQSRSRLASAIVLVDVAARLESEGIDRIRDFMTARPDGFASLEEAADAIAAYNPHRPPARNLDGLRRVLRQRPDGRWIWHWDPAFMWPRDADGTTGRRTPTDPDLLASAARSVRVPTLLLRGRRSDLLSEDGAHHLLELIPHARYVDVAGAGHMVAADRNDAFTAALVDFLGELQRA